MSQFLSPVVASALLSSCVTHSVHPSSNTAPVDRFSSSLAVGLDRLNQTWTKKDSSNPSNGAFCLIQDAKAGEGCQGRNQRWTGENQSCSEEGTLLHQNQVFLSGLVLLKLH